VSIITYFQLKLVAVNVKVELFGMICVSIGIIFDMNGVEILEFNKSFALKILIKFYIFHFSSRKNYFKILGHSVEHFC